MYAWAVCVPVCQPFAISRLQLVSVKQTAITKKKDSRNAVALDSENNNIQVKDIVKVIDGPHSVSPCSGRGRQLVDLRTSIYN